MSTTLCEKFAPYDTNDKSASCDVLPPDILYMADWFDRIRTGRLNSEKHPGCIIHPDALVIVSALAPSHNPGVTESTRS